MDGNDIRAFREKHGFTQPELADAIGMTRGPIAACERGRPVSASLQRELSQFFAFFAECERDGRL